MGKCKDCVYFSADAVLDVITRNFCRFNPPVDNYPSGDARWPYVDKYDW
jgi:hypothetical protein